MSDAARPADAEVTTLVIMAFGELTTFERTATDAQFAPSVRDKVGLVDVAGHALDHYKALVERVEALGGDIVELMQEIEPEFTAFRERTRPRDWYESLMKGYVFDGILRDFYRAALVNLDETSERVATAVLDDTRQTEYLRVRLASGIADEADLASRLALWGRRLVAEAVDRARRLIGRFELAGDDDAIRALSQKVMANHSLRMSALGLVA
jgi:hypothetical protein